MKTIYYLLLVALIPLISCSTNRGVTAAFSEYAHEEGVTSVTVPGWVIRLGARFGDMEAEEKALLRSVKKVRVLAIEDQNLNDEANFYKEFYKKINYSGRFEELVHVRDDGDDIHILGLSKKDELRELIVLVSGDENVIVYLKGKFDPKKIKAMAMKEI